MENISLIFVVKSLLKASVFIASYAVCSGALVKVFRKKKPDMKFYDPEVLFISVLVSFAMTKAVILVVKKLS